MASFVNTAAVSRLVSMLGAKAAAMAEASKLSTTVGVHEEDGSVAYAPGKPITISQIASVHELGLGKVPRRSWLLDCISENRQAIAEAERRVASATVLGRMTLDVAYMQLGAFIVSMIQARIRAHIDPALADSTVRRKKSSLPLVHEGRFINSIRAKLERVI